MKASKADGTLGTKQETGLLVVFNKENKVAQEMTFPGRPIGITLSGDNLFVTDGLNHRVAVIDKKSLTIVKTFGKSGEREGEFRFPKGIAIDEKGFVYIGDTFNGRIQVLDKNGTFVSQYGYYSSLLGGFLGLSGVSADKTGKIYAVDSIFRKKVAQDEIQIFNSAQFYRSGEKIPSADTKLTDTGRKNALYGYFQKPYAMEMGRAKNDSGESLYMPIGLAIDYQNVAYFEKYASPGTKIDYLIWLTSQSAGNGKNITVFGHIAKK
ncbi:MAG: NHL repeat-containing protein [Candidatus Lloydbacteria bacterium]|nr:NHL repeat-containing protein [Candidatus Lloydbacteria bacterium]